MAFEGDKIGISIIEDQEISSLERVEQVGETTVFPRACLPMEDHETRIVTAWERMLGRQLFWKLVIKKREVHGFSAVMFLPAVIRRVLFREDGR